MFPLKKTWLYPAIASIALLASACSNNAAPNHTTPNRTTTNQAAPHVTNFDGLHTRSYDGMRARDFDGIHVRNYDGMHTRDIDGIHTRSYTGYGTGNVAPGTTTGTNAYTHGVRPYTAFPDGNVGMNGITGTAGIRGITGAGTGTGTGMTGTGTHHSIYQKHAWNRAGAGVMATGMPRMGYVQTDRQHMRTASAHNVYVDRDALAQAVGNVTASCPGVQRSTVLVTDEEIFVGLHTKGGDARTAKNQARMNAMSVSPRYYKVYVTDNQNDIQEIARVAARSSNLHTARTEDTTSIDTLIKRMGGTTDGEQMRAKHAGTSKTHNATTKSHMGTTSR
ncbi:YhcN/YlaJ family sporulation lipoprotein [Brevibacillus choshinensis]|uniref:YhcN/YlaJ family sporulation lipoprotein n=1 Tax=Brevibacillus choshinensis TaxID=54911 RepID=UPI002E1E1331|nr:YhcN/YlaJ family sporulation lipoprotein [Brevibacillus choshinensis]MED4755224.1 YhcN/YlaJ family sporulation lipoprotein [Brevibacillus choshinensis]MED4784109.1 YhcN/YlaJ family sporulation lipoprotein [Brevibacillus choshinensis]